ncbi:MAG: methyltransferase domain-containing protein [Gemmatimonadales bacterium]|jgi:ubiquinone/menaquinone biosynthesis C-methylase UbiE
MKIMSESAFDEHAAEYDAWFLKNRNVLQSEVLLLAGFLKEPDRALSVGCGSGLFEKILRDDHGIEVRYGIEPAQAMAEIAAKRGMEVQSGTAEELPVEDGSFDTVIMNGCPSYIADLERAFAEAYRALRSGGYVVVADVPAESSYGLLYQLAAQVGTWDEPALRALAPAYPYPVEFAAAANWRTTGEKMELLRKVGFVDLETAQTLTAHPKFSDDAVEEPSAGHDRGDYVAIRARKP